MLKRGLVAGTVTIGEMTTFLEGTEHQPFVEWLVKSHTKGSSLRGMNFRNADANKDGALSILELSSALKDFVDQLGDSHGARRNENNQAFVCRTLLEAMYKVR